MSYAPILSEPTLASRTLFQSKPSVASRKRTRKRASLRARSVSTDGAATSAAETPLIVHCHLCWDWVWQRPQQFISRLSRRRKVLFVETVAPDAELAAP